MTYKEKNEMNIKKIVKVLWITALIGFSVNAFAGSEQIGTIVGGIAGGVIGNNIGHGSGRTVATIGGAAIGSLVGNQVGSSMESNSNNYRPSGYYSRWDSYQRPAPIYPQRYRHTFIGQDGRLCRRSVLTNQLGDRIVATYCCYHTSPNGYCVRWVRMQ